MRKILLMGVLALLFSSCKNNDNNPTPTLPIQSEKHLLVASAITDYGNGTSEIRYNYDDQNRLTDLHSTTTGAVFDDVADHVYSYDSQGNIIKSVITRGGQQAIFEYTYNNNIPTHVSYSQPNNPSQGHNIEVTTLNNLVTGYMITTPSGETATSSYTYSGNNKIKEVGKSYTPNGNLNFTATFDDEYGTKKNPYIYSGSKWFLPDIPYANDNELKRENTNNNGTFATYIYDYTYNEQGYPVKVQVNMTYSTGTKKYTITYNYINAK